MTERWPHSKTTARNSSLEFRVSNSATIFALGFLLLTAGWLTASAAVPPQTAQDKRDTVRDAPPKKPELRDFAGTWKASFQGKAFTVLTLKLENHKLAGTIRMGGVDLANDGEVSKVNQEVGEARAIFDVKLDGQILSFKDKDGDDVNCMEMKLAGENRAELRFILPNQLPEGMPNPKPFRLTRAEKFPGISRVVAVERAPKRARLELFQHSSGEGKP